MSEKFKHPDKHTIYIFTVDDKPYGIDVAHILVVKELHSVTDITPIPHAKYPVIGYINVRGEIHQVLSLSRILHGRDEKLDTKGLIVYFKDSAGESFGVYVDSLREITEVSSKDIDKWEPESNCTEENSLANLVTAGVCRYKGELISLLSPPQIYQASL